MILLPTGLLGVLEYHKTGHLKVPAGLLIARRRLRRSVFRSEDCRRDFGDDDEALLRRSFSSRSRRYFLSRTDARAGNLAGSVDQSLPATDIPACALTDSSMSSGSPLPARLVLVDRPDESVGIAQGKFAPAPALVGRLARDAQIAPWSRQWS